MAMIFVDLIHLRVFFLQFVLTHCHLTNFFSHFDTKDFDSFSFPKFFRSPLTRLLVWVLTCAQFTNFLWKHYSKGFRFQFSLMRALSNGKLSKTADLYPCCRASFSSKIKNPLNIVNRNFVLCFESMKMSKNSNHSMTIWVKFKPFKNQSFRFFTLFRQ